jgi:ABC-type nitrate/sulfonate/bicarbonate transport system permease component
MVSALGPSDLTARRSLGRQRFNLSLSRLRPLAGVVVLIALWESASRAALVHPVLLPAFSTVLATLWHAIGDGALVVDVGTSLVRAATGLAIALVAGVILGIAMARIEALHWFLDPLVAFGFPAPKIAFVPLFILWFGINSLSKILLVAFACVFPLMIGAYDAACAVNRVIIWSALSMGTSDTRLLFGIMLPSCLPRIFATFRVAVPVALINTFIAEMVAGGGGMGDTLMYAQRYFDTPVVFAYVIVMLLLGLATDRLILLTQRRLLAWNDEVCP